MFLSKWDKYLKKLIKAVKGKYLLLGMNNVIYLLQISDTLISFKQFV